MTSAKKIRLERIPRSEADEAVRRWHYSGKAYTKSTISYGVFFGGRLLGAISLGEGVCTPCMRHIVEGTTKHTYIEINRMAFSDDLPRCSESRALRVMKSLIRKDRPLIEWVVSYSDATQCGDGVIYRAAGMDLIGCKKNKTLWRSPTGEVISDVGIRTSPSMTAAYGKTPKEWRASGCRVLEGYQLCYAFFLTEDARRRLLRPVMKYSDIPAKARMVRGRALTDVVGSGSPPDGRSHRPERSTTPVPHQIRLI